MICKICLSTDLQFLKLPSSYEFGYGHCGSCGVIFTLPKLQADLALSEPAQSNHRFNRLGEVVYGINSWTRFRYISKNTSRNIGKVLDYGCGRGDLLTRFQKRGWIVSGAEFSESTSREVREIHNDILLRSNFGQETITYYADNHFDLITSFHNLEHLVDPRVFIENCARVLKHDGHFVVEVPNVDSWQSRLTGFNWLYLDPRNHTFHFTPSSLRQLLSSHDFVIEKQSSFAFWMGTIGMTSSVINIFRKDKNSFFHKMKKSDSLLRLFLEGILFFAVYPAGIILELLSLLAKSGSVLRIVARHK